MRKYAWIAIIATGLLTTGCASKLNEWGILSDNFLKPVTNLLPSEVIAEGSPVEVESVQLKEDFFVCSGLEGREWGKPKTVFTVEDPKIVLVAKLDKSRDRSFVIVETVSPAGEIAARERKRFQEGEQLGFAFSPKKLLQNSLPGDWRGLFWADGDPIGYVDFKLMSEEDVAAAESDYETLEEDASEPILSGEDSALPPFEVPAESK